MPTAPARLCPGCKRQVRGDCPSCRPSWTRKPRSWSGGSTAAWRRFRAGWLAEHPLCMDCGDVATIVCHKSGTDYVVDRCNPDAIEGQRCEACDRKVTARQGARARWGG